MVNFQKREQNIIRNKWNTVFVTHLTVTEYVYLYLLIETSFE